jgi:hypothetical protein
MANLIERYGRLNIRDRRGRSEIALSLQIEDAGEAAEVAAYYKKKLYPFNDVWTVYLGSGPRMFLWLAVVREYLCPAHKRLVVLAVQIHELNKKRLLLGKIQIRGKVDKKFKDNCRGKNVRLAAVRARLFEDLRKEHVGLLTACPIWASLGPPMQFRLKEWWAEVRPEQNAEYWAKRRESGVGVYG